MSANMIEPFEVFQCYLSIKRHFESDSYNAKTYNYKTNAKQNAFLKRKDKYHFAKLGRKFDDKNELIQFLISQFIEGKGGWVGNMLQDEESYTRWSRKTQALTYTFKEDINRLAEKVNSFDDLFRIHEGETYPYVITAYMEEEITIETVVILDQLLLFMHVANKEVNDTILWPDIERKIRKYSSFISFDREKAQRIIFDVFTR